ncbi:MAG TPA: PKD domain-containing protein [Bacteroidales bacterium]|nr:PKD domain-containing protein [Bacteroidales bacterium]
MKYFIPALICTMFLSLFIITGCDEEIDTAPVIMDIGLNPDTVRVGEITQVVVQASDADGDQIIYTYSVNGGLITGYGDTVQWKAPEEFGVYSLKLMVTDGSGNTTTDSTQLVVLPPLNQTRIQGVAAFSSSIGLDLAGTSARLFTSYDDWNQGKYAFTSPVSGFGPIVEFAFSELLPGTYLLDIWKDNDNSSTRNTGDYYGWYGSGIPENPTLYQIEIPIDSTYTFNIQMYKL